MRTSGRHNRCADDRRIVETRDPDFAVARELREAGWQRNGHGSKDAPSSAQAAPERREQRVVQRSIERHRIDRRLSERRGLAHEHRDSVAARHTFRRIQKQQLRRRESANELRVRPPTTVQKRGHSRFREIQRRGQSHRVRFTGLALRRPNRILVEVDDAGSNRVFGQTRWAAEGTFNDETLIGPLDRRDEPRVGVRPNTAQDVDEWNEHSAISFATTAARPR
jgi:hypothetical protein